MPFWRFFPPTGCVLPARQPPTARTSFKTGSRHLSALPAPNLVAKPLSSTRLQIFSPTILAAPNPSSIKKGATPPGSPQGKLFKISSVNPFPAAPPVETFRYRPVRQSKGPHPNRLRRPGPRLDFAAPGRLTLCIDGRLRRGKVFEPEFFAVTANH